MAASLIDLEIERQLDNLIKNKLSTQSPSSSATPSTTMTACLIDLDEPSVKGCEPVQQISSPGSGFEGQLIDLLLSEGEHSSSCQSTSTEYSAKESELLQLMDSIDSGVERQLIDLSLSESDHSTSDRSKIDVSSIVDQVKKKRQLMKTSITPSAVSKDVSTIGDQFKMKQELINSGVTSSISHDFSIIVDQVKKNQELINIGLTSSVSQNVSTTVDHVENNQELMNNSNTPGSRKHVTSMKLDENQNKNSSTNGKSESLINALKISAIDESRYENLSMSGEIQPLGHELEKLANVLPTTNPEESRDSSKQNVTVIFTNPIGWMFEFSNKRKVAPPRFSLERLDTAHKVTCTFVGMKGEGIGRSSKIAKVKAAENCLKHLNVAMVNENFNLNTFQNDPNSSYKPTNFVGELYEHATKFLNKNPCFETGNGKSPFSVTCSYLSYCETATARSKKEAKTMAASKVYEKLIKDLNN